MKSVSNVELLFGCSVYNYTCGDFAVFYLKVALCHLVILVHKL